MQDIEVLAVQRRPNAKPGEHDLRVVGIVRWVTAPNIGANGFPERHRTTQELIVCENCAPDPEEDETFTGTDEARLPYAHVHKPVEAFGWLSALENAYSPDDY